ncbi:effector protein Tle3 domain-containing protein [Achromobacter spanius]
MGGRRFHVTYQERPNEARRRRMDAGVDEQSPISLHSSIPANAMHSQRAMAYDLAIGQARSIDDEPFYAYLCRVADWRMAWVELDDGRRGKQGAERNAPDGVMLTYLARETPNNRDLIRATDLYRSRVITKYDSQGELLKRGGGTLPEVVNKLEFPTLLSSQTLKDRREGREPWLAGGDGA